MCGTREQVLPAQYCRNCLQGMLSSHDGKADTGTTASDKNAWLLKGSLPGGGRNPRKEVRNVSVANELEQSLQRHQKRGVEFVWSNCFSDCNYYDTGDQSVIGYVNAFAIASTYPKPLH
jgi:hypothetical protein